IFSMEYGMLLYPPNRGQGNPVNFPAFYAGIITHEPNNEKHPLFKRINHETSPVRYQPAIKMMTKQMTIKIN
ncbi:hypothetical protein, partial [Staphylococcus epidermidis]|uniref:hypothetical protein n=1 Tax=Staphylococcus epidermidis TaxID=1282 RepID=UPI001C92BD15